MLGRLHWEAKQWQSSGRGQRRMKGVSLPTFGMHCLWPVGRAFPRIVSVTPSWCLFLFSRQIKELFVSFEDTPLGAASLAQVHKAVLQDGRTVAVKIQHPKVQAQSSKDILLMEVKLPVDYDLHSYCHWNVLHSRATFIHGVSRYNNTILKLSNLHRDKCCCTGDVHKLGEDCGASDCMDGKTEQRVRVRRTEEDR